MISKSFFPIDFLSSGVGTVPLQGPDAVLGGAGGLLSSLGGNLIPLGAGGVNPSASGGLLSSLTGLFGGGSSNGGSSTGSGGGSSLGVGDAVGLGLGVLDSLGLDIQQNLQNVAEFGLSSWGANSNPAQGGEKVKAYIGWIQSNIIPRLKTDPENALTELSQSLEWGIAYYSHLLRDHTRAGSTRASHQVVVNGFKDGKAKLLTPVLNSLKSKGVKIIATPVTTSQIPAVYIAWDSNKSAVVNISHNQSYTYYKYNLDVSGVKPVQSSSSGGAQSASFLGGLIGGSSSDKKSPVFIVSILVALFIGGKWIFKKYIK